MIVGFGCAAVDDRIKVKELKHGTKCRILWMSRDLGGNTAMALTAAKKVYPGVVCYAGVLDYGELSVWVKRQLSVNGVETEVVYQEGGGPVHAQVIIEDSGERTILFDINQQHGTPLPQDLPTGLIRGAKVVLVDYYGSKEGARKVVETAHEAGVPVVGDFENYDLWRIEEAYRKVVDLVDHPIFPLSFAQQITGKESPKEVVENLWNDNREVVVVTDGERGCWWTSDGITHHHQQAFLVQTRDTCGCGDTFHGVYSACLAQERSIQECILYATAAGALKARDGGMPPSLQAISSFLENVSL